VSASPAAFALQLPTRAGPADFRGGGGHRGPRRVEGSADRHDEHAGADRCVTSGAGQAEERLDRVSLARFHHGRGRHRETPATLFDAECDVGRYGSGGVVEHRGAVGVITSGRRRDDVVKPIGWSSDFSAC